MGPRVFVHLGMPQVDGHAGLVGCWISLGLGAAGVQFRWKLRGRWSPQRSHLDKFIR